MASVTFYHVNTGQECNEPPASWASASFLDDHGPTPRWDGEKVTHSLFEWWRGDTLASVPVWDAESLTVWVTDDPPALEVVSAVWLIDHPLTWRLAEGDAAPVEWHRASGDCVCPRCGRLYYDHRRGGPFGGQDGPRRQFLTVLCDGRLVKL